MHMHNVHVHRKLEFLLHDESYTAVYMYIHKNLGTVDEMIETHCAMN